MSSMDTKSHNLRLTSNLSRLTCSISRENGFSLIELLTVVSLIGIMAAIATPQLLKQMPEMRVKSGTRQVMSQMLLLKMKAVSENRTYQIKFTLGGSQYQIKQGGTVIETATLPTGIRFGTRSGRDTSGATFTSSCASDGICLAGGTDTISFTTTGTATMGSIYLIPTEDMASGGTTRMKALSINSSGRVKALKYTGVPATDPWGSF